MIMMSDSGQTLLVMHSNGKSWIELGKEGTIDMFSTNSVNIRTKGDLNLHADRDININAKRSLNMYAENIKVEAEKSMTLRTGQNFEGYTAGKFTIKTDGAMSMFSSGDASYASGATTYINGGPTIKLNTGSTSTSPEIVPILKQNQYTDTVFSSSKSWITPGPTPVPSITSRLTTHFPYEEAGKGVDVTVDDVVPSTAPTPTTNVQAANTSAPPTPQAPVSLSAVATVPNTPAVSIAGNSIINAATVAATVSQNKAYVSSMTIEQLQKSKAIPGTPGITFSQLEKVELIKPGAVVLVEARVAQGLPLKLAAPAGMWTGGQGVDSVAALTQNVSAQIGVATTNMQLGATDLHVAGVLTGLESATQITGVVNAAGLNGAPAVAALLSSAPKIPSILGEASSITSSISAGNFASGLINSIKLGATSLLGGITGLAGQLQDAGRKAFAGAEASIGKLKANKPNVLGTSGTVQETVKSPLTLAIEDIEQAKAAAFSAYRAVNEARMSNKELQSAESLAALQAAEAALAQATQKAMQSNKNGLETLGKWKNERASSTATTSGAANQISILPALGDRVAGTTSLLKNLGDKLKNPSALAGNILSNLSTTLTGMANGYIDNIKQQVGAVTGRLTDIGTKISNLSSSSSSIMTNIKKLTSSIGNSGTDNIATSATGTYNSAAISTKAAQLLGDNRVPPPAFGQSTVTIAPNEYLASQTKLKQELADLESLRTSQSLALSIQMDVYSRTNNPSILSEITAMRQNLEQTDAKIVSAQTAFSALLSSK
jgi:hypothetical protein